MNSDINYKGTRWYKCDLHIHTTGSLCFQDKSVTAEQWVMRAIEQGLDCVAITDHNTGINIDKYKAAAKETSLTIFPGVEITCDSSKVHLLIIFGVQKSSADIRDFLVRADIRADDFGRQEASTTKSIFEIAELAATDGAIVIPAHIDEYNGLESISVGNLKKFYTECGINAVQVVHKDFLKSDIQTTNNSNLKAYLNNYYNNPKPAIDDAIIKRWYTPVKYAIEHGLAILTFSDNPHEPKNSKHGLWGIGGSYTWIKMDESPSLEGMRQAFLLPDYRIRNKFDCPNEPYIKPELWIKSISIFGTTITDSTEPLLINFSPQLNTIIGGRGSGKSSILKFIRGVFNKITDLNDLEEILKDHNEFYRRESGRPKKGVLTDDSIIEIVFVRNDILHKIIASDIRNSDSQSIQIERLADSGLWEVINDDGYIDFFEFEHYSQKQIYEIAQEPNALRERIDSAIEGIDRLKAEREHIKSLFLERSAAIRTVETLLAGKGKIETRIKDLDSSIKKLQQSGIAKLLTTQEKFAGEANLITSIKTRIEERENRINELANEIELPDVSFSNFNEIHKESIEKNTNLIVDGFKNIKEELLRLGRKANHLKTSFEESVRSSTWKVDLNSNSRDFELKKTSLEKEGIDVISSFEKFTREKAELEQELESINTKEALRKDDLRERENLQKEYLKISKNITIKRHDFVRGLVTGDKVKVNIKPFRNKADFEHRLRKLIQRETQSFQADIDALVQICFDGNVEQKIQDVRSLFLKMRTDEDVSSFISGHFVNLVKSLNDAQIDEIDLLLPEDEIEVQYKPTSKSGFKSLSTASAGQKTTAILTFILSYGKLPLILDQPEDDLDNRLVYELIVDRLKQAKNKRQLIVVTHNANVPVNGDAEYIISMDTESRTLDVLHCGTVEQSSIKKEICDVMEGGEKAFEMRSLRYQHLS